MAATHFSGPLVSKNGIKFGGTTVTASLPAASADNIGLMYVITDNGAGNDETAVVISNGTSWTLTTGAALT